MYQHIPPHIHGRARARPGKQRSTNLSGGGGGLGGARGLDGRGLSGGRGGASLRSHCLRGAGLSSRGGGSSLRNLVHAASCGCCRQGWARSVREPLDTTTPLKDMLAPGATQEDRGSCVHNLRQAKAGLYQERAISEEQGVGCNIRKVSSVLPSLELTPREPSLSTQVHT